MRIIVQGVQRGLSKLFLNVNHCFIVKYNSKHATRCGLGSSLPGRQIEISSDSSLGFVLPTAVKDKDLGLR